MTYFDVFFFCLDPALIVLKEDDIDDPTVKVDLEKLQTYTNNHLKRWLLYCGDSLKGVVTLRDSQVKVLQYFHNGTNSIICDPTLEKKWLSKKAYLMGKNIKIQSIKTFPMLPENLKCELLSLNSKIGWSKCLEGLPAFSAEKIDAYALNVNSNFFPKSTKVKKHLSRGEMFLEEQYIDLSSIHSKQSIELFCVKGVCAASMKKIDRWIFIAIKKLDGSVMYAFCECPAGKTGTCSHAFEMMKLVAKWVIEKLKTVPNIKACTSRTCAWSIPQSRKRFDKTPISDLQIISPQIKKKNFLKRKLSSFATIKSSLHDRTDLNRKSDNENKMNELYKNLLNSDVKVLILNVLNQSNEGIVKTSLGSVPFGSVLSYQCAVVPPSYNVYYSLPAPLKNLDSVQYIEYPTFPFNETNDFITCYIEKIFCNKKNKHFRKYEVSKGNSSSN